MNNTYLSVCDFVWVYVLWGGGRKVLSYYARMKQVPSIKPIFQALHTKYEVVFTK